MCRINYVEVSVLAMFTSIALFFWTRNVPVSLTLAALSYFTLLAHAARCKREKTESDKSVSENDMWIKFNELDEKLDRCCPSDKKCCSPDKSCFTK